MSLKAAAVLLGLAALPGAAHAAMRNFQAAAATFAVDSPCARTVTIQPDASLNGQVVATATADHEEELAQLIMEGGNAARLRHTGHECWQPEHDFEPTLDIAIRVPPAMAVAIDESGGAEYTIGALQGPLSLDISGGVKLHADHSGALTLDLSGGGTIDIAQVDGSAKADISGGGNITLGQVNLADLHLEVSGGGVFALHGGTTARASVEVSGAASVQIGGTTGDATVDLSGAGSVRFAKLTGQLTKDVSGMGSLVVDSH